MESDKRKLEKYSTIPSRARVLAFKRSAPADKRYFWSVVFECVEDAVLSVKINGVGGSDEDKQRVVECLRNLADDIEFTIKNGSQT